MDNKLKNAFPEFYQISAYGYIEAIKDWHKHLSSSDTRHKMDLILAAFDYDTKGYKLKADDYFNILICFQAAGFLTPDCMNFVHAVYNYHIQFHAPHINDMTKEEVDEVFKKSHIFADKKNDKEEIKDSNNTVQNFKPKKFKRTPFGMIPEDDDDEFTKKLLKICLDKNTERDDYINAVFDSFFGSSGQR